MSGIVRLEISPTREELEKFLDSLDSYEGKEVTLEEDDKNLVYYAFERMEDLENDKQDLKELLADLVEILGSEDSVSKEFHLKTLIARAEDELSEKPETKTKET
jgi:vacuolar-type H+-ATPase subunit D/Vma8